MYTCTHARTHAHTLQTPLPLLDVVCVCVCMRVILYCCSYLIMIPATNNEMWHIGYCLQQPRARRIFDAVLFIFHLFTCCCCCGQSQFVKMLKYLSGTFQAKIIARMCRRNERLSGMTKGWRRTTRTTST